MCIRDSVSTGATGYVSIVTNIGTDSLPGFTYSCLLYTSDAADEEHSVDLGGRRFIQAEDGIRDRSPSRGLGDVYKRQCEHRCYRLCFHCYEYWYGLITRIYL